jgi:hypothetical protein
VHEAERLGAMRDALAGWRETAARRRAVRVALVGFVNRRRLEVAGEYLAYWRQYAAAMRADVGGLLSGGEDGGPMRPLSPMLAPRSAHQDRRLIRRMALLKGSIEVRGFGNWIGCMPMSSLICF